MENKDKSELIEVFQTTDYDKFINRNNRELKTNRVHKLKRDISENNYLAHSPIIVNSKMEIQDGQHRLAAAVMLKTPIYYIVIDECTDDMIFHLNNNRANWSAMDLIKGRARKEIQANQVVDLVKEFEGRIQATSILVLCIENYKRNIFEMKNRDIILRENYRKILIDFAEIFEHKKTNQIQFAKAFLLFIDFATDKQVKKLKLNASKIGHSSSVCEALTILKHYSK